MMSLPASTVVSSAGVLVLPVLEPASPAEEDTPEEAAGAEEAEPLPEPPQAGQAQGHGQGQGQSKKLFHSNRSPLFWCPGKPGDTLSINHYSMHSQ